MQTQSNQLENSSQAITQQDNKIILDLNLLDNAQENVIDCLIILNCKFDADWLQRLVACAKNIILADGGANHFYKSKLKYNEKIRFVAGDLDSLRPEVKEFYKSKNIEICLLEDQNYTDFQKTIRKGYEIGYRKFVCIGALGGRMDHTLSAISSATYLYKNFKDIQLILMGDDNLMYPIRQNIDYTLKISKSIQKNGCGVVAFDKADIVQTTGFKWNLGLKHEYHSIKWGEFISTCNIMTSQSLTIKSSDLIFFVCRLKPEEKFEQNI